MKNLLSLCCFLFVLFLGQAQVTVNIDTKAVDFVTGKKLSGVTINVLDGATVVKSGVTPSNGNLKFNVPTGKKYKVEFTKPGKVTRFMYLDSKNIEKEMISGASSVEMGVEVSLFDELPNVDYSYIENNPFTEYYFDGTNPTLAYDEVIKAKMKKKIESLMAEVEKKESQKDANYQKAIEAADGWYKQQKYDLALSKYEEALLLKPKEPYPAEKVKELDALIKAQKQNDLVSQQNEELYKKTLASADALKEQKKYSEAIAKYNEALKLKDEQYVKDQIAGVNKLIEAEKAEKAANAKYNEAVSAGEAALAQKNYAVAKEKFTEASKLKPMEALPKDKLLQIDAKLKEEAAAGEKKKKYTDKIAEADQLFNAGKLAEAKTKYNEAVALDNTQAYPKDKVKEIDAKIAADAKAKERITTLLKEGAGLYAKNDLENAKAKYQEVIKLDASNAEASAKLAEINTKIAANQSQAQKEEQFKKLKAQGNDFMTKQSWTEAKQVYLEAKAIKADPEIDAKLKEIETKMAADAAYYKLLQEAQALEPTNIDGAIAKYKEALAKKPTDENVKKKIADLEKAKAGKANEAETEKKYAAAMKKGDAAMTAKKYTDAIAAYNEALALKPTEKEPVTKAAEAEKLAKSEVDRDKNEAYAKILDAGQKAIDEKNWDKAKDMYGRALKLRPDDIVPKNKMKEIEALIKAEQDAKMGAEEKEKAFKARVAEAEQAASAKDYDKAINLYNQAKQLKPEDKLPPKRIQELTDLKAKEGNAAQQEAMYKEYMNNGNQAVSSKDYQKALSEYKNALTVKAGDKTATAKITEVEQLIANETNNQADQKLKAEFNALVQEGDALFKAENWKDARSKYEAALGLIGTDAYAKKQVDKCIENLKKVPDDQIQYNKLIKTADNNFNKKNYDKAKEYYERALTLRATDQYPKDKLLEIEAILNPKPVIVSTPQPLPSLGVATSGTPQEVQNALELAEIERQNREKARLTEKTEQIQNEEAASTERQTLESQANVATLSEIKKDNEDKTITDDESRQKYVEKTKEINISVDKLANENNTLKYNEQLNTKETLKNIESENSVNYATSDEVYMQNTQSYKTYKTNEQDERAKEEQKVYESNIQSQGSLSNISVKVSEDYGDDFEARKKVESVVERTEKEIAANEQKNEDKESASIESMSQKLKTENEARSNKFEKDAELAGNNKESLKTIENKISDSEADASQKNVETSLTVDKVLAVKQQAMSEIPNKQDLNRTTNVEDLKSGANKIDEADRKNYLQNLNKNLTNQDEIATTKRKGDARYTVEEEKVDMIAAQLDGVDKKAAVRFEEANLSDEEQRLNTKQGVSNIAIKSDLKTAEDTKKASNNAETMKVVTTDLTDRANDANLQQTEKINSSRLMIDEIAQQKVKFTDKVGNEIGALYPEGVSQEIFNQNDEDGLLVSVVTRRIVVKKGFGQVYIRTQSLNGITYSKNGSPSSEYVWQRETEDALLQKNY